MQKVSIDKFRIVPAPLTGIGWVAVQEWDSDRGEYRHVTTLRSEDEANAFISKGQMLD